MESDSDDEEDEEDDSPGADEDGDGDGEEEESPETQPGEAEKAPDQASSAGQTPGTSDAPTETATPAVRLTKQPEDQSGGSRGRL